MGSPVSNTAKSFEQAFIQANQSSKEVTPQVEKPKQEVDIQKWKNLFSKVFEQYNPSTRNNLSHPKSKVHIEKTQETILKGASHLTKDSVVLVLGAQYFGKNNSSIVEPLAKLVSMCKQLILVDHDIKTLECLRDKLNDSKVVIRQIDLSCGICDEFIQLGAKLEKVRDQAFAKRLFHAGYGSATSINGILKVLRRIPQLKHEILGREHADYVISSLVASEIPAGIIKSADVVTEHLFDMKKSGPLVQDLADNVGLLFSSIISTHIDLIFSLSKPLTGRVYFSDTTETLQCRSDPRMTQVKLYESISPKIGNLKGTQLKHDWKWSYEGVIYKVESWIFSKFPKDTRIMPDNLYIAAYRLEEEAKIANQKFLAKESEKAAQPNNAQKPAPTAAGAATIVPAAGGAIVSSATVATGETRSQQADPTPGISAGVMVAAPVVQARATAAIAASQQSGSAKELNLESVD